MIGIILLFGSDFGILLILVAMFVYVIYSTIMMKSSDTRRHDSLFGLLWLYSLKHPIQVEIDGLMVHIDDLYRWRGRILFKNTNKLKFVEISRGEVTGIGLDNGVAITDIFLVHRLMEIDDLSPDKLRELIKNLNKCLADARAKPQQSSDTGI